MHHGADVFGCVVQTVDIRRSNHLHLTALRAQFVGDVFSNFSHAFHILAAGFDVDEVLQRIEQRLLLLLCLLQQFILRRGVGNANDQS